jgi:hypothetical protein
LFEKHLRQSAILAEKELQATCIDPDPVQLLVEHKTDLLFNRQLRFNRQYAPFRDALEKSDAIVGQGYVQLWVREINLLLSHEQLNGLFSLAS